MIEEEKTHAEIIAIYSQAVEDIRTFQDRQAAVATSVLAVLAGLVAFAKATKATDNVLTLVALAATVAAVLSGVWLVSLQLAMNHARDVVLNSRNTFTAQALATIPKRNRPSFRVV